MFQTPVDAVGAEVVHEEGENGVREKILSRSIRGGREIRSLEGKPKNDRIQIRQMCRRVDDGADLFELADRIDWTLNDDSIIERRKMRELRHVSDRCAWGKNRPEHGRHRTRSNRVDARI